MTRSAATVVLALLTAPVSAQTSDPRFECTAQQTGIGNVLVASLGKACVEPPVPMTLVQLVGADDPRLCGQCLRVSAPQGAFNAFLVGTTPPTRERQAGDLLLAPNAATSLGLKPATPVSWITVPCDHPATIQVDVELEPNAGLRVRVSNSLTGLVAVRLRRREGEPLVLRRSSGNTFSAAMPGQSPWRFELEDVHGRVLDLGEWGVGSGQDTRTQFPVCSLLFSDGFEGGDLSSWGRQNGP